MSDAPAGMKLVERGSFLFGNDRRPVELDAFFCDIDPVSMADYDRFLRKTGWTPPLTWPLGALPKELESLPVVHVSLDDAIAFAKWVEKAIPTEEQWEKAARGTDGRSLPWGGAFDAFRTNTRESVVGRILPVSALRDESPFGIRGTSGNVKQWTTTVASAHRGTRAVKGGSYRDYLGAVAWRTELTPDRKIDTCGFRCVRLAP